jgi:DNA-binding XRE family transcriptional regulator
MATKPVVSRGGKMKQINNSVLDWLVGPFSKRPDQFDQDDWVRLHQANEDTLYYVQNHEEYLSKKALEESQPIFDPIKFKTSDRFRALRIWTWLSLQEMADMLGVSRTTATKYEREGFKDGLKQNQIDSLVTYIGDVLYKSNKSPTHAESLRFMIRATDKVVKDHKNEFQLIDLNDIPIDSTIKEWSQENNVKFLKDQEHFKKSFGAYIENADDEVLKGRLDMLDKIGKDLVEDLIINIEEVAVIHEQLLIKYLGENLAKIFIQEKPTKSVQDTVEQILHKRNLKTEDFLLTEVNRITLLNKLYRYLLPKYPTTFTKVKKNSQSFDEPITTPKGGKNNG